MAKQYRQGDLLLVKDGKPWGMNEMKVRPSKVLLLGEATGHAHKFADNEDVEILDGETGFRDNVRTATWLRVKKEAKLVHDEHKAIVIPIGYYRVVRQREFDGTETRFIAD
jgi:hypothetical protein